MIPATSRIRLTEYTHKERIDRILALLERGYGPLSDKPLLSPISELVRTILTQNTSDVNSDRAYSSLVSYFPTWQAVVQAKDSEIAEAIRSGGLAEIKSSRIRLILKEIMRQRGELNLDFLRNLPLSVAKAWLKRLPGVGPKTAACVLLFSLDMPAMPVDTHVHRVSRRLRLLPNGMSAEKAHDFLENIVSPEQVLEFHLYLILHGRRICKSRKPLCRICTITEICPSAYNEEIHL
ncbi:endonuclease III domain-containing protein [Chloroflexota bacterium]